MNKKILAWLAVGLLASPAIVSAAPIAYSWSGTGSGTLGEVGFSNAQFTLTVFADTGTVFDPGNTVLRNPAATATVNIAGVGTATLGNAIFAVFNPILGSAGISDFTQNRAILFVGNSALAGYDLASDFGPVSGNAAFNPGLLFPTSSGSLSLLSILGDTASFRSAVRSVPEPGTLALLALGLAGLGLSRRRRPD